ncbi:aromatic ring-opening dioxygenase LigA [Cellulomonas marina]|uniref:Aromatic ring-opening dioxygenase LigA n=1 Tax=Cellulomonas marina TaxID=988821 RepID=A0A1I0ZBR0_9CELL|nr:aromatic ring-opening dioxygenase LigA [Cellulomonas marina]GIG29047.1 hypothetical protein Cma02nite_16470 [Cellulomonas marina]SFB21663.1 hypothetical protein SAMN05421867_11025 [Cellulomonas marina]
MTPTAAAPTAAPRTSTTSSTTSTAGLAAVPRRRGTARVVAVIAVVAGALLVLAGVLTWAGVASTLAAEDVTVSADAATLAGRPVTTPWTAWVEADVIAGHALDATGGRTYAELDREDPLRAVAMDASFLRASLFTSVVAFGVAALVAGVGVLVAMLGAALLVVERRLPPLPARVRVPKVDPEFVLVHA